MDQDGVRERKTDGQTDIHSLFFIIIHSVSLILRDIWLECCWSSSRVPLWFWCSFFFSFENGIFPQGSWRWGSTKWNKTHLNNSSSDEMCDLVFTQTIFSYRYNCQRRSFSHLVCLSFSRNMFSQTQTLLFGQSLLSEKKVISKYNSVWKY